MAKQIFISMTLTGASGRDSEAPFLAEMSKQIDAAVGGSKAITMLAGSAWRGAKATIEDGESSQNTADAMAQAIFDKGGPTSGYAAQEIDAGGTITDLTGPTPS